ncbi:MAG: hypothetical protein M1832_004087 [Thelocarpon impressellum]|nr:MAG: hypothetical protein M1832_004087 [Thelocarpon impressellum]
MAPRGEKSQLKRGLPSTGEEAQDLKKPRRSQRIGSQSQTTPLSKNAHLPSPVTHQDSTATEDWKEGTATPPEGRPSQIRHREGLASPSSAGLSSPPNETQVLSQFVYPPVNESYEVESEQAEGVWGYLVPLDVKMGGGLVLKKRSACPIPSAKAAKTRAGKGAKGRGSTADKTPLEDEEVYEEEKVNGISSGGYLIGRHPECDYILDLPTVSNRHCLFFPENSQGKTVAMIEDLSSNGTFVNEAMVGRNKRRQLKDGDEITILDEARFTFHYPRKRSSSAFFHQYDLLQPLGKGHFATVYLCVEKTSGFRYAVKVFSKRPGVEDRTKTEGLQQEIAVLMGVSHPNMLCLKDTFDEENGVYLVLELAPEGELFNWIIIKSKLSEAETRKVFVQLFQGVKYLHERGIVHRDIKPENILLVDKELTVKLADFGLAKIIGEESFTTTLCGTPSYVAPEILEDSKHRKYTRAVDVWSLGVVLYICLSGFPPFSDELNTKDNPYTLSQQIKLGRFDYPSPYWDPVGDPALDLIDRMLTVDVDKRITIDECLEHPWITERFPGPEDSTDGLTEGIGQLDFSKRKLHRERTLLSSLNEVKVAQIIEGEADAVPIKVFEKNTARLRAKNGAGKGRNGQGKEEDPATHRDPEEFMELGGKGDQALYPDDAGSRYVPDSVMRA